MTWWNDATVLQTSWLRLKNSYSAVLLEIALRLGVQSVDLDPEVKGCATVSASFRVMATFVRLDGALEPEGSYWLFKYLGEASFRNLSNGES
jgi:hypothetical protein